MTVNRDINSKNNTNNNKNNNKYDKNKKNKKNSNETVMIIECEYASSVIRVCRLVPFSLLPSFP